MSTNHPSRIILYLPTIDKSTTVDPSRLKCESSIRPPSIMQSNDDQISLNSYNDTNNTNKQSQPQYVEHLVHSTYSHSSTPMVRCSDDIIVEWILNRVYVHLIVTRVDWRTVEQQMFARIPMSLGQVEVHGLVHHLRSPSSVWVYVYRTGIHK